MCLYLVLDLEKWQHLRKTAGFNNYLFITAETILLGKEVFDCIEHLLIRFGYQNLLVLRIYSCMYMVFLCQLSVI